MLLAESSALVGEVLQLVHELGDVLERAEHRRKPHIRHVVQLLQAPHHLPPDELAGDLPLAPLLDAPLHLLDDLVQLGLRDGALLTRRGEAGLTLIELVVSVAIIGVALAGTLGVMRRTIAGSADPMLSEQALSVAEAYLEEILAKPFYDPDLGPPGGVCPAREASRTLWDNVCDYDTLDDTGARDQTDTALPGLGLYRVRVGVDP